MAGDEEQLRSLVDACLARDRAPATLPVLTVWAPRGSGHSDAVRRLESGWEQPGPHALVASDRLAGDRVLEVLLQLTRLLGEPVRRFGALSFPRFALGFLATRGPLDDDLAPAQRDEMVERTLGDRRRASAWFTATANAAASILGGTLGVAPDQVREAIPLASQMLDWLENSVRQRSAALAWYRTALPGADKSRGIDGLVELVRYLGDEPTLDDVLVRAVLEDLRRAYDPTLLRLYARRRNCLAVLDDAAAPVLRRFTEIVTRERARGEADPLLIVESSDRRYPAHGVTVPDAWRPRRVGVASAADWLAHRDREAGWAARYPLAWAASEAVPPTARPEAPARTPLFDDAPVGPSPLPRGTRHALTAVRRLTAHHPRAVELVVEALAPDEAGIDPDAVRGVLAARLRGTVLDDLLLDSLVLAGARDVVAPHLARAALCRSFGAVHLAPVFERIGDAADSESAQRALDAFVSSDAWVELPEPATTLGPPMLHPFVRRVVAHRLGRGMWQGMDWCQEHRRLQAAAQDRTTELYHGLACGDVTETAVALGEDFTPGRAGWDVERWLGMVEAVTSAPVREPRRGASAGEHHTAIVDDAGPVDGPVRPALVAALQLHTDPLGDPEHQLCATIAFELGRMVPSAGAASRYLINRAGEFRACADR